MNQSAYLNSVIVQLQSTLTKLGVMDGDTLNPLPFGYTTFVERTKDDEADSPNDTPDIIFADSSPAWFGGHYAPQPNPQARLIQRPLDAIQEALDLHPRFVLLGETGSGKTTVLQYLAFQFAQQRLQNPNAPIPLWVPLSAWEGRMNWQAFLESQWTGDAKLVKSLLNGEIILLIDGLDELEVAANKKIQQIRDWLFRRDNQARLIATCRSENYGALLNLEIPVVYINPLEEHQIHTFVKSQLPNGTDAFLAQVFPPTGVIPAAKNITFLTRLLTLFQANPTATLPITRGRILRHYHEQRWSQIRDNTIPFATVAESLARLAVSMLDENEKSHVEKTWAYNHISGKRQGRTPDDEVLILISKAEQAEFIATTETTLAFSHRWIQNAFLAEHLLLQTELPELNPMTLDSLTHRRTPDRWDDALLLLCDLTPEPDAVLQDIAEQDPAFAAQLIIKGVQASAETLVILRDELLDLVSRGDGRFSGLVVQLLPHLGETAVVEKMLETIAYGNKIEQRLAIQLLGQVRNAAAAPVLVSLLPEPEFEEEVAHALIRIGSPAVPEVLAALNQERWETVFAAIKILKEIRDIQAIPALIECVSDDEHEIRWAAADALGSLGESAVQGLAYVLREEATAYVAEGDIRRAAASALAWTSTQHGLDALIESLQHPHVDVRCAAIESLIELANPTTVPVLIQALEDDAYSEWADAHVDELAADALEAIGTPEALAAVEKWEN